eukprot:m.13758 g.13758  ORF g.13758 m.13758 type:complete len:217 (+) comp9837_c0_seq1:302-952(+)
MSKRRQADFKAKGPHWRDVLRQKCLARIKQERAQVIASRRSGHSTASTVSTEPLASRILAQEWSNSMEIVGQNVNTNNNTDEFSPELLEQVYDELTRDLVEAEQRMIQDIEDEINRAEEMAAIEATIADQTKDAVVCPICCKHWLMQNNNVIFCACGFRVDTQHDGGTLATMKSQLDAAVAHHESVCTSTPTFQMDPMLNMLTMKCVVCAHVAVVL